MNHKLLRRVCIIIRDSSGKDKAKMFKISMERKVTNNQSSKTLPFQYMRSIWKK
jgi:hypothetical protein